MSQDPSAMRASHADRERAADVLKTAVADGRLDPEEYEDRLGAALSAKTYGELDRLVEDLPAPAPGTAVAPAGTGVQLPPQDRVNGLAVATFVAGLAGFTGLGAIVAMILGPVARRQIRETGERGARLATVGQVFGYIYFALAVLMLIGLVAVVATTGDAGPVPPYPDAPPPAPDAPLPDPLDP